VVERLAARLGAGRWKSKYAGRYTDLSGPAGPLALLIPTTYMNLSGDAVGPAAGSLRLARSQVLVVHDDLDLPFGAVRGKVGGGSGGHNGLKSITQSLGGDDYLRVRIGIGRPPPQFRGDQADWVLMAFMEPKVEVDKALDLALAMTEAAITDGIEASIARFHAKAPGSRARTRREDSADSDAPEQDETQETTST
jgi:peptidyl-tRNA hydrolase, PTH1 family